MDDFDEVERLTLSAYTDADPGLADELRVRVRDRPAPVSARGCSVLGNALMVVYRLLHDPAALSEALPLLRRAHRLEPSPSRAANLAAALQELADFPGNRARSSRGSLRAEARVLLTEALAEVTPDDPRWSGRSLSLLSLMIDEAAHTDTTDIGDCIDLGERVLEAARAHGGETAEAANLLGSAYRVAADQGHPRGDLDRAVALLYDALDGTPEGHPDRPIRASNLGTALMERFDATGRDVIDLSEAVTLTRQAHNALPPTYPGRFQAANNLLNALLLRWAYIGGEDDAAEAFRLGDEARRDVAEGDELYPVVMSNAGLAARAHFIATGRDEYLDAAVEWHMAAVRDSSPDDPGRAGRLAGLALVLGDLYHHTGDPDVLTAALRTGRAAIPDAHAPAYEAAGLLSNLANLHHDGYLRSGRLADLEEAARLHRAGLRTLPDAHPLAASLLNNAGIALTDRYERFGDAADLLQALEAFDRSVGASRPRSPDLPARKINFAAACHRLFEISTDGEPLDLALRLAKEACEEARDERTRAVAEGTYADVLITRLLRLDDREAAAALAALPPLAASGPPSARPGRLLREGTVRRILGAPGSEERLLRACEEGLEHRPAVTLTAARQLAMHALEACAEGDRTGGELAETALAHGSAALDLLAEQPTVRQELAWRQEARGLAAAVAQTRLLAGDAAGALRAHETGHGVILGRRLAMPSPQGTATQDTVADTDPGTTVVALWSTPHGGGAAVARPGESPAPLLLPQFTDDLVTSWTYKLRAAAPLGGAALASVLEGLLPQLAALVTEPVSRLLDEGEPVVLSAAGLAALLPYAAGNTCDGVPFVQRHPVRCATTRQVARWAEATAARRHADRSGAWSFAAPLPSSRPELPAAAEEGERFADAPRRLVGEAATVEAAAAALPEATLLHFACHAGLGTTDPLANHLLLAGDAPWYGDAIADARTESVRLVVLSACGTADVGREHALEGLGLAGAFHLAGVPGVVASLWPTGDRVGAGLMTRLAGALDDGREPVDALRAAMLAEADAGSVAAWAPYVLLGA